MSARMLSHHLEPDQKTRGFTLIELLVVLAIIAIIVAIVSPLVPGLIRGDQFDSNVNTLTGILEEARESATANNTFVWVAFTDAPANSQVGTWVASFQSQDGTDTYVAMTGSTPTGTYSPVWTATGNAVTIPGGNLLLHARLVNLPNFKIDYATGANHLANCPSTVITSAVPSTFMIPQNGLSWTVTTLASTGSTGTFTHAIQFTPNGEAHVQTTVSNPWASNIQFGFYPASGTINNYLLVNLSRLTGRATTFRK